MISSLKQTTRVVTNVLEGEMLCGVRSNAMLTFVVTKCLKKSVLVGMASTILQKKGREGD